LRTASAVPSNHSPPSSVCWAAKTSTPPLREAVEAVGEGDVVVEGGRVELRQDSDVAEAGVDRVRERHVDEPVLSAERNGRLGPVACKGVETLSLASAEDDGVDAALRHFSHG